MKWKKGLKWLPSIISIVLILVFVEGGLMWSGIGMIILFHVLMVSLRIYRQRHAIKTVFSMAGQLGSLHKQEAALKKADDGCPIPKERETDLNYKED